MGGLIDTMQMLTVLTLLLGLFSAIFWMIVGWRAMRAHEKLADSMEWFARQYYRKEQDRKEQDSVSSIED